MIKPTAPLLVIVLTAVFLFLAATNIQGGWLYLVDALLWAIVLMAFVLPWLNLRRFQCERRLPGKVSAREACTIELVVTQPNRWPLMFVNIEDRAPRHWSVRQGPTTAGSKGLIVSLKRDESFCYSYDLTPDRPGVWIFEGIKTGSFGPLGLLGLYRQRPLRQALVVQPRLPLDTPLQLFSAEQQQALQQARHHSHHNEDISHYREYQPGDSRRQIHWKNTARQQKLIVAEAREEPFQQALVLVDTAQNQDSESFLRVVETASAVCYALLKQNLAVHCLAQAADPAHWADLNLPTPARSLQNLRNWEQVSPWLATLMPDASLPLSAALSQQGGLTASALMVVIAAKPEPALLARLRQGRQATAPPILVFAEHPQPESAQLDYRMLLSV